MISDDNFCFNYSETFFEDKLDENIYIKKKSKFSFDFTLNRRTMNYILFFLNGILAAAMYGLLFGSLLNELLS